MSPTELLAAPEICNAPRLSKFERERLAFEDLKPGLLAEFRDRFVAIHDGQVVAHGDDLIAVAEKSYSIFGRIPIYVDQVTKAPRRIERGPVILGRDVMNLFRVVLDGPHQALEISRL